MSDTRDTISDELATTSTSVLLTDGYEEGIVETGEEDEEEEEEEEEIPSPKVPPRVLCFDEVGEGLSHVGKTATADGYAYLKCSICNMLFTDIEVITDYQHLQYIVLNGNRLTSAGIAVLRKLPFLYVLIANNNRIETLEWGEPFPNLEYLTLKKNRITSLKGINQPRLMSLDLKGNKVRNFNGLDECNISNLCRLSLINNKFTNTKKIPNILEIDLSYNKIKTLDDLHNLKKIEFLNLTGNKITNLSEFHKQMKNLKILFLSKNEIENLSEFKKLKCLENIMRIDVEYNSFDDSGEESCRPMILAFMPSLKYIDGLQVTKLEIEESKQILKIHEDEFEFKIPRSKYDKDADEEED